MEHEQKLRDNVDKKEERKIKQDTKPNMGMSVGPKATPHSSARQVLLNLSKNN